MRINIFLANTDMFGIRITMAYLTHLLRIIQNHSVMKVPYPLYRVYVIQSLDIKITHSESLF